MFLVLGTATLFTGVVLLRASHKTGNLGGIFLSTLLLFVSLFTLLDAAAGLGAASIPVDRLVFLTPLGAGAMVCFAITYPDIVVEPRHEVALGATGGICLGLAMVALLDERLMPGQETFLLPSFLLVLLLLGARWLGSPPGDRRTQITWGLIPFLFFAIHDGLGFVVFPIAFGSRTFSGEFGDLWGVVDLVIGTLLVIGALVLAGVALSRVLGGDVSRDAKWLALSTLTFLPLSFLQLLDPSVHLLLDFLFVALVVYAVARYGIVDLDLKVKWGLEKSTVAGVIGVAFLAVSEAVETLLDLDGMFFGIGAAVAIGLVFRRIEHAAEELTDRLMPGVEASEAYLDGRRETIYRAQAESLLADGEVSPKERGALDRLRDELGMSQAQADRIEAEARAT